MTRNDLKNINWGKWSAIFSIAAIAVGFVWHVESMHTQNVLDKADMQRRLHDLEIRCSDSGMDSIRADIKYLKSKIKKSDI